MTREVAPPGAEILVEMGPRIYSARCRIYGTRTALGRAAQLHPDTIRGYEQGRNFPHAVALRKLMGALGVTSDYLLFGITTGMTVERLRILHPDIESPHGDGETNGPAA